MLDGLEVMERKRAHQMLFEHLAPHADKSELQHISSRIEEHLQLPAEEKEAGIENVFRDLATFTARTLGRKCVAGPGVSPTLGRAHPAEGVKCNSQGQRPPI